tara:strand:+ start:1889 stop:2629 length:741 start_codon:yes stop_codon:yes gene_type:complete
MNSSLSTIILAAGKGTRMNSKMPKVLHKVGNQSMIMHVINTAYQLGAEKILAVLGYQYKMIQESIDNPSVEYVLQEKQLGTAHAVLQCQHLLKSFNGNILILYGDAPLIQISTLSKLLKLHEQTKSWCTLLTTDLPNPTGYGRIIRNQNMDLIKIVEEKDATNEERKIIEVNSGFYLFNSKILFRLLPLVKNDNNQNEYYLPDVINLIIKEKGKVAIDKINNYIEIQGVNNIEQLTKVNEYYKSFK